MTCLNEDVQKCFRPRLESLGIYNYQTGITNNAAESANAAFKRAIGVRPGVAGQPTRQNFFQAVSLWYFYQAGRLSDIMLGLQNLGDLHIKDSIGKLYAPENIRDVVNQDVIASLVLDGKYPDDMLTKRQYNSKNFFELTTLPGMAKWFVEANRITLLPKQHVFVVTDLLDTQYMVCYFIRQLLQNSHVL